MTSFLHRFRPNRLALLLLAALLLGVEPAFAVEGGAVNEAILGFAGILSIIIHILTFLVLLIMSWGGDLIGTTFLTGPEAMESIRPMWVFVRNIVNISFVLVLVFLAFANLFTQLSGGGGNWTIKDKLPRVIIALIAVNFSLLIFRVAIDAVHVGTITILSITDTVMDEKGAYNAVSILESGINNSTLKSCDNPQASEGTPNESGGKNRCIYFYEYIDHALCPTGDANSSDCLVKFNDEVFEGGAGRNKLVQASSSVEQNIFWAFGTYFQKLEWLPTLVTTSEASLNTASGVVLSTLFSSIMAVMYAIAWVAIFIALAVRIVVLWGFMIASPALLAAQIMGIGGETGNLAQRLVTNLIMPLKIAAAFAVSFVMIATMIEVDPGNFNNILTPGAPLKPFWGAENGPFSIMWQIMTIVIFWMTVWWALKDNEASFITDGVKGAAESAGKFTGTWALDKLRLPVPGKAGEISPLSLLSAGNVLDAKTQERIRERRLNKIFGDNDESDGTPAANYDDYNKRALTKGNDLRHTDVAAAGFSAAVVEDATVKELEQSISSFNNDARRRLARELGETGSMTGDKEEDSRRLAKILKESRNRDEIPKILSDAGLVAGSTAAAAASNQDSDDNTPAPTSNPTEVNVTVNQGDQSVTIGEGDSAEIFKKDETTYDQLKTRLTADNNIAITRQDVERISELYGKDKEEVSNDLLG